MGLLLVRDLRRALSVVAIHAAGRCCDDRAASAHDKAALSQCMGIGSSVWVLALGSYARCSSSLPVAALSARDLELEPKTASRPGSAAEAGARRSDGSCER